MKLYIFIYCHTPKDIEFVDLDIPSVMLILFLVFQLTIKLIHLGIQGQQNVRELVHLNT